jgi:predicted ABC-type ATPase
LPNKKLQKRIRIFAGPNGSGKSTLYSKIKSEYDIRFGYYINADEIYAGLKEVGYIETNQIGISASKKGFGKFYNSSGWKEYVKDKAYLSKWNMVKGKINIKPSKLKLFDAAILADYIRYNIMKKGVTFTFETVMSHVSKIDFINEANKKGFKVYLYFIATEDPKINLERVKLRVEKGGHDVPDEKVRSRYYNTLDLLFDAVKPCYRSFIFDSTKAIKLVASVNPSGEIEFEGSTIPRWFKKYLLNKIQPKS